MLPDSDSRPLVHDDPQGNTAHTEPIPAILCAYGPVSQISSYYQSMDPLADHYVRQVMAPIPHGHDRLSDRSNSTPSPSPLPECPHEDESADDRETLFAPSSIPDSQPHSPESPSSTSATITSSHAIDGDNTDTRGNAIEAQSPGAFTEGKVECVCELIPRFSRTVVCVVADDLEYGQTLTCIAVIVIGFDDVLLSGNRKRPRINKTHTYSGGLRKAGNGATGVMMYTYNDNRMGGWVREGNELERMKAIMMENRDQERDISVVITCYWYRRFNWHGYSCWNGSADWKAYYSAGSSSGEYTDITTADGFSDGPSDWSC
ncbi:hypothetical protein BJ508DRAFT_325093 [Ascobolus immersus RN42]|uniref:Uncharacterized protein n=1 Tax=Ascobolus immersus RN42 TaxID=1160509 RepID=A0A3N4IMW2_ASCIM|nr:hypothetical protein BJ508DRAFT_325093 [Ascobolus immersus RN42]